MASADADAAQIGRLMLTDTPMEVPAR
jgi:hypothetical protein